VGGEVASTGSLMGTAREWYDLMIWVEFLGVEDGMIGVGVKE
jgi:hypothetical protein